MLDLLTIGRISVDLYGQEEGHGLSDPQTFQKSVGGSPTNVAIGTARYGHKTAVITGVASDALGKFAIDELKKFSVSTEFVIKTPTGKTPIVVAGIKDPDNPEFIFYQCGVDVLATDKLGRLGLSPGGVSLRDEFVFRTIKSLGVPVVCSMGGGYSPSIKDIVDAHVKTFKLASYILL